MSSYIERVISKLTDFKVRKAVENEFLDHFEELVNYYIDIGYNEDRAKELANEKLGNTPEEVGEQLSLVNANTVSRFLKQLSVIVNIVFLPVMLIQLLAGNEISFHIITISVIIVSLVLVNLLFAIKFKSNLFTVDALVLLAYLTFTSLVNGAQLTTVAIETLLGRLVKLISISEFYLTYSDGIIQVFISLIIIGLLVVVSNVVFVYIERFKSLKTKKRNATFIYYTKQIVASSLVIIVCFYSVYLFEYARFNSNDLEPSLNQIEAYESDVYLDENTLKEYCKYHEYREGIENYAFIHFELFTDIPDLHLNGNFSSDINDKELNTTHCSFDGLVHYNCFSCDLSYTAKSKYVYLIPKYYDTDTDLSKVICVKSGSKKTIKISYQKNYYEFNITVN